MMIVGLDLSLTSSGVARWNGSTYTTELVKPRGRVADEKGHVRLAWVLAELRERTQDATLAVVEGPSYGSPAMQRGQHERGGLWWMVTHQLWLWQIPIAVASPESVKKYATGKGGAGKDLVLASVVRRFEKFDGGNDEADALILAAIGADHRGHPIASMPQTHRDALNGVTWPTLERTQ